MKMAILISKTSYSWPMFAYGVALIAVGLSESGNAAPRKGRCGVAGRPEIVFRRTTLQKVVDCHIGTIENVSRPRALDAVRERRMFRSSCHPCGSGV